MSMGFFYGGKLLVMQAISRQVIWQRGKFGVCMRKRARLCSLFQMACQYTCQQRMLLTRRIQALAGRRGR
jgi:hypothetical protein